FTFLQTIDQILCREVNIDYLIRLGYNTVRHTFLNIYPSNLPYFFIQAFNMLDIDRTDHINACVQNIEYILPAFFIVASFYVGMSEFIYNDHLWSQIDN